MKLAIESHGSGEPILFIHGLGGVGNIFHPQVTTLSRFFECHRFDLPGAGRSESQGQNSIASLVEDTKGVLDALSLTAPVHIVAHSMGTIVAQHLALKYPHWVKSLVLLGPVHALGLEGRQGVRGRGEKARNEGMVEIADQIVGGGTSAETKAARPAVTAFIRELIMGQDPEGYALHCEALSTAEPADLSQISVPTLLITGDEDNTAPPPAVWRMAASLPDAEFLILPRTGHWPTIESPEAVTDALLNFLCARL